MVMSDFERNTPVELLLDDRLMNTVHTDFGEVRFPYLLTTGQVARLLRVHPRTVLSWVEKDTVPYIELPNMQRRELRFAANRLAQVLGSHNYDVVEMVASFCEQEFRE
jgi:hypothetical protein